MAVDIPESFRVTSVAFDIPIEKKEINSIPSTVQLRLAGQLDSPRKETSLEDISKRLSEASKRKQENLDSDISKVASHNAKAHTIFEKAKEQETEKAKALEECISSKLSNAEARKDSITTSWVQRLSQNTLDKLQRGSKVKADEEWSAKELETKIDIKSLKADLRREELKLKNQEELAAANHDKLGRGQLALSVAEVEARQIDARSEQKIIAAEHRREMNQILSSARISESAALKKERVEDMFKRENEQRRMLLVEIEEKMRRAEERKEQAVAEKNEAIAAQTKDKLQRAADVGKREEQKTKERSTVVTTKVEMVNQRRDEIIREQQEILKELAMKKERLFIERKKEEEKAIEMIGKVIRSKLHSATKRKEGIIASKVESIKINNETKQARAKDVLLLSLNEATELKRMSDKRIKKATKKKNALLKAMVDEKQYVNRSKIDKVEQMNRIKELEEIQRLIDIEKKLAEANANRESHLLGKLPSNKMTAHPSPRELSASTHDLEEIETRINQANLRREIYLAEKVDNATKNRKSPTVKRTLFAAAESPKSEDGVSEFEVQADAGEENDRIHRGPNLYLVAIGGIAVAVIVKLISYWKHNK